MFTKGHKDSREARFVIVMKMQDPFETNIEHSLRDDTEYMYDYIGRLQSEKSDLQSENNTLKVALEEAKQGKSQSSASPPTSTGSQTQ